MNSVSSGYQAKEVHQKSSGLAGVLPVGEVEAACTESSPLRRCRVILHMVEVRRGRRGFDPNILVRIEMDADLERNWEAASGGLQKEGWVQNTEVRDTGFGTRFDSFSSSL